MSIKKKNALDIALRDARMHKCGQCKKSYEHVHTKNLGTSMVVFIL